MRKAAMPSEAQIQWVLTCLAGPLLCPRDGTRLRYGDLECPHCGADLDDTLREWATRLLQGLEQE